MSEAPKQMDEQKLQAVQAMDYVCDGLSTGIWGIVSGYVEHPVVCATIMERALTLYLNSLMIYHDKETAAKYARNLMDQVAPYADCEVHVTEDDWFDQMSPRLLEKLG